MLYCDYHRPRKCSNKIDKVRDQLLNILDSLVMYLLLQFIYVCVYKSCTAINRF